MVSHEGRMVSAIELIRWIAPGQSVLVDRAEDRMILYGFAQRLQIPIATQREGMKYRIFRK